MNTKILFYLAPLVNKWLQEKYHEHGVYSFKNYIKKELGKDWLNQIHTKCLKLDKQVKKNTIVHEIGKIQLFYLYLNKRGNTF